MMQQLLLVGNLGSKPEMRYTPAGQAVTNFSLATNRRWTDPQSGQQKEETTWWRVSVWGASAEACNQYLDKGRQVLVIGRIRPDERGNPRVWTAQDGTTRASFEVTAERVQFLGGRNGNGGAAPADNGAPDNADEIPF